MANREVVNTLAGRKLMVCVPTYDGNINIESAFALPSFALEARNLGIEVILSQFSGCSIVSKARNALVANFLESGADYLLFIDADVIVDTPSIIRLLALGQGKDVTAGLAPRRGDSMEFMFEFYSENGNLVIDSNGLVRVSRIGAAFMLIQRRVIETLVAQHPEWAYTNGNDNGRTEYAVFDFGMVDGMYCGEDYMFCNRVTAAGFEIFIDPFISLPHVGVKKFARNFAEDVFKPMIAQAQAAALGAQNG